MAFYFDHAIIAVYDLDEAIAHYEQLGFTVIRGGEHSNQTTHNALICFRDGTYLELLAPTGKPLNPQSGTSTDFSVLLERGEGLVGYALGSDNIETDMEAMRQRGISVSPIQWGSRVLVDKTQLRWKSAMIGSSMEPFFIQDITERRLRVPDDPASVTHANGVIGISGLSVLALDEKETLKYFVKLLKLVPRPHLRGKTFRLEQFRLTVMSSDSAADYLGLLPHMPFNIYLTTTDAEQARSWNMTELLPFTHQARLILSLGH